MGLFNSDTLKRIKKLQTKEILSNKYLRNEKAKLHKIDINKTKMNERLKWLKSITRNKQLKLTEQK